MVPTTTANNRNNMNLKPPGWPKRRKRGCFLLLLLSALAIQQFFLFSPLTLHWIGRETAVRAAFASEPSTVVTNVLKSVKSPNGDDDDDKQETEEKELTEKKKKEIVMATTSPKPHKPHSSQRLRASQREEPTTAASTTRKPVVDILSIGSERKPDFHRAQAETFGQHPAIRQFVTVTELNDTEKECASTLMNDQIVKISNHCRDESRFDNVPKDEYTFLKNRAIKYLDSETLLSKPSPTGWLCAQRRPIDGIYSLLQSYKSSNGKDDDNTFPDYLIVMDDDTWVNMDQFLPNLQKNFTQDRAYMIAGCRISSKIRKRNFKFAYGGWGYTLTRPVLKALTKQRTCPAQDAQDEHFCNRLSENAAGERDLFVNGASVLDLMYKYAFHQNMVDIDTWTTAGYCMYSDWVPAYFIQYYALAKRTKKDDLYYQEGISHDRLQVYQESHWKKGGKGQCAFQSDDTCTTESHLCHYVTPNHMRELHKEQLS